MRLHDGTILKHRGLDYDPVKAHEYYLRTRKLHPRKPGQRAPSGGSRTLARPAPATSDKRAAAAQRVKVLQDKLTKLKAELRKRMGEAEVDRQKADKPATAAEKAEKARDSKKYRDKHKSELASKAKKAADSKSGTKKKASIDSLKKAIDNLEAKLDAAVARQKALG